MRSDLTTHPFEVQTGGGYWVTMPGAHYKTQEDADEAKALCEKMTGKPTRVIDRRKAVRGEKFTANIITVDSHIYPEDT